MGIALAIVPSLAFAGMLIWAIWSARTGAVVAGEKGNDGLIPSSGEPGSDSGTGHGQ